MNSKKKNEKTEIQEKPLSYKKILFLMYFSVIFGIFYIAWRAFYTVNYNHGEFSTFWSFVLLGAELYSLMIFISFALAVSKEAKRPPNTKRAESKPFYYMKEWPTVDIFITTINEEMEIVKDTLTACMNIDYPNKKVFLLDDGRRKEMLALTKELGCEYITRATNQGYKAGNVNNALKQTNGEIVVIFDADHIPVSTFLKETIGFFDDRRVALLQTPQYFLNLDPFQKNLNLEKYISNEQELFYKIIEPGLAEYEATICGGTNFLMRRKYVEEAGYFPENTITEDFAMSLRLQCKGYKVAYYNKPLATGKSVETFADYIKQRSRWAKGNLQALLDPGNYKNLIKLKPIQFFFNFMGAFYFLYCFPRIIFILSPVLFILCGVMPVQAIIYQIALYQIIYFSLKIMFFNVTAGKYRHFLFTDVYESATSLFLSVDLMKMFLIPNFILKTKFVVTNKSNIKYKLDYNYFIPLLVMAGLVLASVFKGFYDLFYIQAPNAPSIWVNIFWSIYNMGAIIFALKVTLNKPEIRKTVRIPIKTKVKLYNFKGYVRIFNTINVSKTGALLTLDEFIPENFFENCYLIFPDCNKKRSNEDKKQEVTYSEKTFVQNFKSGYKLELIDIYKKDTHYYYRVKLDVCKDTDCPTIKNCLIENIFSNSHNWHW